MLQLLTNDDADVPHGFLEIWNLPKSHDKTTLIIQENERISRIATR